MSTSSLRGRQSSPPRTGFHMVPLSETVAFVLFTVGLQRNLDIDGQLKCLREKDKNEWIVFPLLICID